MKRYSTFGTALLLFTGALAASPIVYAADSTESTLTTQTRQMDTLTTSRGEGTVSSRISGDFSGFAGSTANSDALVSGLRNGTAVTLTSTDAKGTTTSTTFTPPTGKMGYGNVYTSLALAKQQLAGAGITDPSAQQLQASLMGGTVTNSAGQTTTMTGVLQLRADGMGWGQIAQHYGYKLGPVISGMKSSNAAMTASTASSATGAAAGAPSSVHSNGAKSGIVTGAGVAGASHGQGQGNAYGRGIVTGAGTGVGAGSGHGNAYGRGIVTGGGEMAGSAGARSGGQGKAVGKGN
jgi:hypothetical protein